MGGPCWGSGDVDGIGGRAPLGQVDGPFMESSRDRREGCVFCLLWRRETVQFPLARMWSQRVDVLIVFGRLVVAPGDEKMPCSLRGLNPRPMAHKTIALTTELREHVQ